jgi:hypothetical protein
MYYQDLTNFSYYTDQTGIPSTHGKPQVNVGWLDEHHAFPRGSVPQIVRERILFLACLRPFYATMGFHRSPFIKSPASAGSIGSNVVVEYCGQSYPLGSAEIRVPSEKRDYASPNLISHYISDCGYLPPQEFLDAVLAMEMPKEFDVISSGE